MFKRRVCMKSKDKMSNPVVSVVDVYEIATDMGKSIERIMDVYGSDAVKDLMPKVINVLELLETFASSSEQEMSQVDDLRCRVAQLEIEKIGKAEDRLRYEKELEQIEDHFKDENRDLLELVARLQDENKRLAASLQESAGVASEMSCNQDQDLLILQKMKEVIEKQRLQLRLMDSEKQEKQMELDACQAHIDKLTQVNKEMYRKQRNCQLQTRALIEEKAEMQAQLQDQQRELISLKEKGLNSRRNPEDFLKMKSPTLPDLSKKVMYDVDDPDRPRFTMNELRKILFERNDYKARVSELMDELEMLRPKTIQSNELNSKDEEGPVQGPINRDPDDAPWKKHDSNSGIRKLFRILFGDSTDSLRSVGHRSSPIFGHSSTSQPRAMLH